jgi:hypothetical protein
VHNICDDNNDHDTGSAPKTMCALDPEPERVKIKTQNMGTHTHPLTHTRGQTSGGRVLPGITRPTGLVSCFVLARATVGASRAEGWFRAGAKIVSPTVTNTSCADGLPFAVGLV